MRRTLTKGFRDKPPMHVKPMAAAAGVRVRTTVHEFLDFPGSAMDGRVHDERSFKPISYGGQSKGRNFGLRPQSTENACPVIPNTRQNEWTSNGAPHLRSTRLMGQRAMKSPRSTGRFHPYGMVSCILSRGGFFGKYSAVNMVDLMNFRRVISTRLAQWPLKLR